MEPQLYIGGQAVIEGVMMRGGDKVAVAVRKPDNSIHVEHEVRRSWTQRFKFLALPLVRGTAVLFESTFIGYQALNKSANLSVDEEGEELSNWQMALTLIFSLAFGVGLFILAPLYIAQWVTNGATGTAFAAIEGVLRLLIFVAYMWLISRMKDIQRVFMYHGAEHKTINCFEAGEALTVENVRRHTLIHKRCGTSFLLFVMVISIILFSFFSKEGMSHWEMMAYRIGLMPVVAGLSYELIRWSGNSTNRCVAWLVSPGMLMQRLTTKEPDDSMIEVAIASVQAVIEDGKAESALPA
ncbi:DUF1385 domain-containing protein [Tumebacillus permanentifrigoris]|uniref:Uncharacterized protein YqhQ n=1 Tax=Tumebacillus permanentifrigoris TaxID=378543 RepID=A0A316DE36_9BACL|nr:DUF1385 domain-containing protein [Tumebacillus permanentifrigoris]PWK16294.1 uncharacterized protein YqhQ [Tumebacillus permanentifrigoris]